MHTYGHWHSLTELKPKHQSFTYKIWFPQLNKRYIGVKKIYNIQNKETDWKRYKTSSKYVNELLDAGYVACYSIVEFFNDHKTAGECERDALRAYDILNNHIYLNRGISGYAHEVSIENRLAMSIRNTGKIVSQETRDKLSAKTRKSMTPERRKAQGNINRGKKFPDTAKRQLGINNTNSVGYIHTPDGVYGSAAQAAAHFNVSYQTILKRCRSTTGRFNDWYISDCN